ncbi:MAG: hypothetical protein M1835_003540 [Candelina submexicana]|nr:MAG: hypothetical protein M1835_003540 [Candelina submexicana]
MGVGGQVPAKYQLVIYDGERNVGFQDATELNAHFEGLPVNKRSEALKSTIKLLKEIGQMKGDFTIALGRIAGKQVSHEQDEVLKEALQEVYKQGKKVEKERRNLGEEAKKHMSGEVNAV